MYFWWVHQNYNINFDFWISKKPKIAHNSLNNWVRAVLTPFLDYQFFWTFWLENLFFWGKNQELNKKSHQYNRVKYPKFVQNQSKNGKINGFTSVFLTPKIAENGRIFIENLQILEGFSIFPRGICFFWISQNQNLLLTP